MEIKSEFVQPREVVCIGSKSNQTVPALLQPVLENTTILNVRKIYFLYGNNITTKLFKLNKFQES